MNIKSTALTCIAALLLAVTISGCSMWPFNKNKQPKSSFKLIPVDEDNPNIIDTPERAGTKTRNVDIEMGENPGRQ